MSNRLPPQRLICLLLTLVLVFSLVPMSAGAAGAPPLSKEFFEEGKEEHINAIKQYNWSYSDFINAWNLLIETHPHPEEARKTLETFARELFEELGLLPKSAPEHVCVWTYGNSRTSHYLYCCTGCDARKNIQPHNHEGENGNCTCGYEYYTNATLTALGLEGLTLDKPFDPAVTEYTATPVAWKEVTETRINAFPFDALAEMEISEDLTVKPGAVYTITITADDDVTTQTYTITVAE